MKAMINKYVEMGIIPFSVQINQKQNMSGVWKKDPIMPTGWQKLEANDIYYNKNHNGIALKTGKESRIFVLDIDNVEHWNELLQEEEREEPHTVKAISGSGGIHLYFKYTDDLDPIKNRSKAIKNYDIDVRSNGGCIYAPPTSYYNENSKKTVTYIWEKSIFENQLLEVPKWLKKLLIVEKVAPIIRDVKPTSFLNFEIQKTSCNLSKEQLTDIINMLSDARADSYSTWIEVLFALKCNNSNDNFELFNNFSQRSSKYDVNSVMEHWNKYDSSKTNKKLTYASLIYWAKIDNPEKYATYKRNFNFCQIDEEKIEIEDTIMIEQPYLLMNNKIEKCNVSCALKDLINNHYKVLMIKSPYNTGKTTLLKQLCEKNNYARILFISYRITLTHNLYGNFRNLGFKMYTDNIFADRLICQVDSLRKINNTKFDLIIIDESESVLNHFNSASLENKYDTFQLMVSMCYNAKSIVCLDGDLNNRSKFLFKLFGDCRLIENTIKKDKKHFTFTSDNDRFTEDIMESVTNDKNICIVSMSEGHADYFYEIFKEKHCKVIKYTSKTSDKEKKLLCEVEAIWTKYQIVIYSPSIEAGVDFNIEHFDKIYITMSSHSTSQRGLFQMISRIRQLNDPNILCLLNNISKSDKLNECYYNFNEIKTFYESFVTDKIDFIFNGNEIERCYNKDHFDTYDIIYMYNKQETLNKNSSCFLPIFIKMLLDKGHTYENLVKEKCQMFTGGKDLIIEKIACADQISNEKYEELEEKQALMDLTEDEKIKMIKHFYEDFFNEEMNDFDIVKKYYNTIENVTNLRKLLKKNDADLCDTILEKDVYKKTDIMKKIISEMHINIENLLTQNKLIVQKDDFLKNYKNVYDLITQNKILLNIGKNNDVSEKRFYTTIKDLLSSYGILLVSDRKKIRIGEKLAWQTWYEFELDEAVREKLTSEYYKPKFYDDFIPDEDYDDNFE